MPPTPGNTGRIGINYLPEKGSNTFLFQPKDLVQLETAWDWQRKRREMLMREPLSPQAVWLLEHHSCYTIGRGSNQANVLFDTSQSSSRLHQIDRGGDVTHHLEGQLVAYLVIDLHRYKTDLSWYLRELEQVLIDLLNILDLPGERLNGLTGVWCKGLKVASIGVGCRRWITQHGLALNVNCDLAGFKEILPCGLNASKIGKLDFWIPDITVKDVNPLLEKCLCEHFGFTWIKESNS